MKTRKLNNGVIELLSEQDEYLGEFYREVDGYYVFWPARDRAGFYSESYLRELADRLRDLNAEWDAQVSAALQSKQP